MAVIDAVVQDPNKNSSFVHLDLDKKLAKQAKEFKPGQKVKVVLVGSVDSLSLRKPMDPEESGFDGSMSVRVEKLEFNVHSSNAFAELMDDD